MDLTKLREQIDSIDEKLVNLYEERMDVCAQVAEYKISTGKKVFDRTREQEKLKRVKELTHNDFNSHGVEELFEQIMSMSRKLQYQRLSQMGVEEESSFCQVEALDIQKARVVFQGAEGAYSEAAVKKYFGEKITSFHVDSFRDAMSAIAEGNADFAVLPIENSTAGIVSEIYDLLAEFDNFIVGEQIIQIEHCLLGIPGTKISEIKRVYSHPQSLLQSAKYLSTQNWQQISMENNAFAAKRVSEEKDNSQAAIASEYAAQVYGLEVLKKGVNQSKTNSTRFIIISNEKIYRKDAGKISICFEIPHESGSLYHMLSHFIYNNLNMTKIESRPIEDKNWEYRFFVDFEGKLSDSAVKNAMKGLGEEANNLRILGNY